MGIQYAIISSSKLGKFYNILVTTLGKLLMYLVNYVHYKTFFIMERLDKECFAMLRIIIVSISIISYEKNSLDLQST